MTWLSLILVFGTLAVVGVGVAAEVPDPRLGAGEIIYGRVPWLLLGVLWVGVTLAAVALFRGRRLPELGVLLLEIAPVAYVTWYVLVGSAVPPHTLTVDVGDAFPGYALVDQDGARREVASGERRAPALYIFYRGGW